MKKIKRKSVYWSVFLLAFFATKSFASETDLSSFNSVTNVMMYFINDVNNVIQALFLNSEISDFVYREWTFFTILMISKWVIDYVFEGTTQRATFELVLTVGIVKVLLDYYDPLTSAFWAWSIGFAEGIQYAAVGTTDLFFLPSYLFNICKGLNFSDANILTSGATVILAIVLGTIFSAVLAICAVLTSCWAIWSYSVAKIVGWMFVPTLMFDRLSFLFDGWLKFFFSSLLYNIVARANLVLVAIVIKSMVGASSIYPASTDTYQIVVDSFQDVLGLGCFLVISILALISTGKFASAIVGGVSMGGGSIVRTAVRAATKGAFK